MIDLIIPTYNANKTLDRCLDSVANQDCIDELNVFLIDDNSSDNYDNIIKKYTKKMKLNYIKLEDNHGPGYARQYGIEHSNSKYIMFIDSDDVFYDNESVSLLKNEIINKDVDVVFSNFLKQKKNLDQYDSFKYDYINLHGKILKREFLENNNIKFPNLYGEEDNAFCHLLIINKPTHSYIDKYTYKNLYNENSLTETNNNNYFNYYVLNYTEAFLFCIESAIKNNCDKDLIAYWILDSLIVTYLKIFVANYKINGNKEIENIKKLITYYDEYIKYLSKKKLKEIIQVEMLNDNYIESIINCPVSFAMFIELSKNNLLQNS